LKHAASLNLVQEMVLQSTKTWSTSQGH